MGNKKRVTGSKMSVVDYTDPSFAGRSARRMARDIIEKSHSGPGDTIESAAYRAERTIGVDANILMQGWNREPRGMLTHRWLPLFHAWCAAGFARADKAYEDERARHEDSSALVRLADFVAGRKVHKEEVK